MFSESTVKDCTNTGSVQGKENTGGIVGYTFQNTTVSNCINIGTVNSDKSSGGIVGRESWTSQSINNEIEIAQSEAEALEKDKGVVKGCTNSGKVSGSAGVGGIAGSLFAAEISNCLNTGEVKGGVFSCAGGIAGAKEYGVAKNCTNVGVVTGGEGAGGILGSGSVSSCLNRGAVSGEREVGGICGSSTSTIEKCRNDATVTGEKKYVGGIVGKTEKDNICTISQCGNTGAVIGGDRYAGGVVGSFAGGTIQDCYNRGIVYGYRQVGGIAGEMPKDTEKNLFRTYCKAPESGLESAKYGVDCMGELHDLLVSTEYCCGGILGDYNGTLNMADNWWYYKCAFRPMGWKNDLRHDDSDYGYYENENKFADANSFPNWKFDEVWRIDANVGAPALVCEAALKDDPAQSTGGKGGSGAPVKYYDPLEPSENKMKVQDSARLNAAVDTLTDGWWAVSGSLTLSSRITVSGNVDLILQDGAELTAPGGIDVPQGASLTIWGQSGAYAVPGVPVQTLGTGRLTVTGPAVENAGVGGSGFSKSAGAVTVNGGVLTVQGGDKAAGIGGGNHGWGTSITINGGAVTANGGKYGAGIGGGNCGKGSAVITGGYVAARGGTEGAGIGGGDEYSGGTVEISGGCVLADGGTWAAGIGGGGVKDAEVGDGDVKGDGGNGAEVTISSGTVIVHGGDKAAGIGGGNHGDGGDKVTITGGSVQVFGGETWGAGIGGGNCGSGGTVEITGGTVEVQAGTGSAQAIGHGDYDSSAGSLTLPAGVKVAAGSASPGKAVTAADRTNACRDNKWAKIELCSPHTMENGACKNCGYKQDMPYVNANGQPQTPIPADQWQAVTGDTAGLTGGWWAVTQNVTLSGRITVSGNVNLILCDGAELSVPKGIYVPANATLTIWGQSVVYTVPGTTVQTFGTGRLTVNEPEERSAGIGGNDFDNDPNKSEANAGGITVNGGILDIHGGDRTAGIGGGNHGYGNSININGGTVIAQGGKYGAGIGGGNCGSGNAVITGGYVRAQGGSEGAGIGGGDEVSGGTVEICGGTVEACGGPWAAGIGGGGVKNADPNEDAKDYPGGNGGTVTITGGTVTAQGGVRAAGIGGGNHGSAGDKVTITGGLVKAIGSKEWGAGIGGGNCGNGGTVEITGGTVEVQAGSGSAQGIGQGDTKDGSAGSLTLYQGARVTAGSASPGNKVPSKDRLADCRSKWARIEPCSPHEIENGSLTCKWCAGVPYYDPLTGTEKACETFKTVGNSTEDVSWNNGWFVASGNVNVKQVNVQGQINLILCDGATLSAEKGIRLSEGNSLTVWGQSGGSGTLAAYVGSGVEAGIGGNSNENGGRLTVNGGNVTATGGVRAAGIGGGYQANGGTVEVNGGTLTVISTGIGEAIGHGENGNDSGSFVLGKPDRGIYYKAGSKEVVSTGEWTWVDAGKRVETCRKTGIQVRVEPCTAHEYEKGACKYCGAADPNYTDPKAPTITAQPKDLSLTYGYTTGNTLSVTAQADAGYTLSYQWYSCQDANKTASAAIDGETESIYSVSTGKTAGTTEYYFCKVTATRTDKASAEVISDTAKVTVSKADLAAPGASFTATGAASGTLSGLVNGVGYTLSGGSPWSFTASGTTQNITGVSAGNLLLMAKGNDNYKDSEAQDIQVTQAAAPTGLAASDCSAVNSNDGKIAGLTPGIKYEYRPAGADAYTQVADGANAITGLAPGAYYVRVRAVGAMLASPDSDPLTVSLYDVTVNNGWTEDSPAAVGATVTIKANKAVEGQVFDQWTGVDGLTFTSGSAATSTASFTMPARAVEVTATFKDDTPPVVTTYSVTVNNGTADKSAAAEGDTVTITADAAPAGQVFDQWTGVDGLTFTSGSAATSTASFTMPARAVEVTANYKSAIYTLGVIAPTFDSVKVGYAQPAAKGITITSTGNSAATITSVALDDTGANNFTLNKTGGAIIEAGVTDSTTYTVQPKSGLTAETYTATITVTYNNDATATADVSFTVSARDVAATPAFTPAAGNYSTAQNVTIASTTEGATIYYTTDGSYPTASSAVYSTAISVTATTTIKAMAVKEGMDNSAIATAEYTIQSGSHNGSGGGGGASSSKTIIVSASAHGTVKLTPDNARAGETVTATLQPDKGYRAAGLTVTDKAGKDVLTSQKDDVTWTFTMQDTAVTVSPVFEEITKPNNPDNPDTPDVPGGGDVSDRFRDVSKTAWYHDAVKWAVSKGLMNGVSEDTFAPNETCTRAMVVTMLWRLAGEPVVDYLMPYTDVSQDAWYAEAVRWAASTGTINGTSETTFSPNTPVTREQLAAILYRYAQAQGFEGEWMFLLEYPDADQVSDWAYESLCWMTMHGVITGMGDGTLAPKDNATRAQIATMFMRFVEAMSE